MRREAKNEVAKAKSKAYDELYEELDTSLLLLLLHLIPTFMWGRCAMTYASV